MITFNKLGTYGLFGNQLFQYSTLYSIAKTRGYEFGVPYANVGDTEFKNFFLPNCFKNLSAKDSSNVIPVHSAMERNFTYNAGIFGISDNTDICGYFQSEKYFIDYREQLLIEFEFKPEIKQQAEYIRAVAKCPAISLHMRFGDYVAQPQNHPPCTIEYYTEALSLLPDNGLIFVFSDDLERAQNLLQGLKRPIVYPDTKNKYIDMCVMTLCNYHIIANSSFSWWGAWLSHSNKVIAPATWFGSGNSVPKNWSDIYCKNWTVL